MTGPVHDVAHIAHAELLTPFPDDSLRFFVDLFGMQIEHQEGQSVFLRGWGEYQPYGLKLTESELPGLGHTGLRAWSPEALERRVAAIDATGLGIGWNLVESHGAHPAAAHSDLLDVGTEAYLAASGFDHRLHHFCKARRAADRIVGTAVVGASDQGMLQQRRRVWCGPVVAPARTEHGAQQGVGDC